MSSPLKFALGVLGAASIGSMVFSGSVDSLLAQFSAGSAEKAAAVDTQPGGEQDYNPSATTLAADRDGHFRANIRIEGMAVTAVVDTGASMVAISAEDAQRIGLYIPANARRGIASTANGKVPFTVVNLREVRINGITVRNVDGAVMPPGALQGTLLGMSFLNKLSKFEMQRDRLVLAQ